MQHFYEVSKCISYLLLCNKLPPRVSEWLKTIMIIVVLRVDWVYLVVRRLVRAEIIRKASLHMSDT